MSLSRKYVIVNSAGDSAGANIHSSLLARFPFEKTSCKYDSNDVYTYEDILLITASQSIVNVCDLDNYYSPKGYVFISKHRAESGIPSLTAHFTGNFGDPTFGGRAQEISPYSPSLLKKYMQELHSRRAMIPREYKITLEATHHGPTSLQKPLLFVELGSTETQWVDQTAASCISEALVAAAKKEDCNSRCGIALGGTHYPEKFNKLLLESDVALGPIAPKYSLKLLDKTMLEKIISKSDQKVGLAVLDYKGLGTEKARIIELVNSLGLTILKL